MLSGPLPACLTLTDNQLYKDISSESDETKAILARFAEMTLDEWVKSGVTVISSQDVSLVRDDDCAHSDLSLFTLGNHQQADVKQTKCWISTHNCMGVVRLRGKQGEKTVQIQIGSRFDEKSKKQFFLTYLLSKVFGGSIVDLVDLGYDSLWDMLLAFVFRRGLLEASAVGLFKQYRTLEHNDCRVRGRIDVDRHLCRNIPFCGNVAYATHDITFNNPTNHLIRHALAKVGRKWGGLLTGDNALAEMRHQLEQNTPTWQVRDLLPCIRCKENRTPIKHPYFHAKYEPLRKVSLALLRDEGAGLYQQQQEAEGVIFDGSWLWEEYVWTLLQRLPDFEHPENRKRSGAWVPLEKVTFYPDFFHREKRVVLDAKYKRHGVDQEDAKQVFAYMFLLDAVHGGLIKPDAEQEDVRTSEQQIKRQGGGSAQTRWHNLVLSPPDTTITTTAKEFVSKMNQKEEAFIKCACLRFGIDEGKHLS